MRILKDAGDIVLRAQAPRRTQEKLITYSTDQDSNFYRQIEPDGDPAEGHCARALAMHARSISSVKSMLQRGIEAAPIQGGDAANNDPIAHDNVRGADYYQNT